MTLKSTYNELKKHLSAKYRVAGDGAEIMGIKNRINCRAVALTFLHQAIKEYKLKHDVLCGISCREAIIHMLYEDAALTISDLNQITPSLALKILDPRLAQIDASISPDFQKAAEGMIQWFVENREWISRSHEAQADLPELQWSDLPRELFALNLNS
ncbi:hypothetical protein [Serratia marcescens]|uniref:hypothetical protein n=1 Tax=Serratia marcescens TaxID=615 RepID=UPI00148CEB96|nr:hypothetical protein [Serratia marcescens]QJU40997.1 hypothetical protein HMI62_17445 [Serratia marcescens]